MEILKTNDQVLFYDGNTILELTTVIQELEDSTVKLSNGVICSNEPVKKSGIYKRKDYLKGSKFQGWIKKYEGPLEDIYQANLFLKSYKKKIDSLKIDLSSIQLADIIYGNVSAQEVLNISKSLNKVISKCKPFVK